MMPELLHHLGKEVCGECETRIWYAGGKRRPPDPPISMLIGKNVSWVVQSIRALAGTHVEANIEIGGAGVWLPRNPTGAPAHKPLFSSGAIIRASTPTRPQTPCHTVLRPLAMLSEAVGEGAWPAAFPLACEAKWLRRQYGEAHPPRGRLAPM